MATVLTLHQGGEDPAEIERLESEAAKAMAALADAAPISHKHFRLYRDVAGMLKVRTDMHDVRAKREAIKRGEF